MRSGAWLACSGLLVVALVTLPSGARDPASRGPSPLRGAAPGARDAGADAASRQSSGAERLGEGKEGAAAFQTNVVERARENAFFRDVLFTGKRSQLALMSLPQNGELGEETHEQSEELVFVVSGQGKAIVDGVTSLLGPGDMIAVGAGSAHNVVNLGAEPLKLYTVYAPPAHLAGRKHPTKADSDRDVEDKGYAPRPGISPLR